MVKIFFFILWSPKVKFWFRPPFFFFFTIENIKMTPYMIINTFMLYNFCNGTFYSQNPNERSIAQRVQNNEFVESGLGIELSMS